MRLLAGRIGKAMPISQPHGRAACPQYIRLDISCFQTKCLDGILDRIYGYTATGVLRKHYGDVDGLNMCLSSAGNVSKLGYYIHANCVCTAYSLLKEQDVAMRFSPGLSSCQMEAIAPKVNLQKRTRNLQVYSIRKERTFPLHRAEDFSGPLSTYRNCFEICLRILSPFFCHDMNTKACWIIPVCYWQL